MASFTSGSFDVVSELPAVADDDGCGPEPLGDGTGSDESLPSEPQAAREMAATARVATVDRRWTTDPVLATKGLLIFG
jgi:hypothetical protein